MRNFKMRKNLPDKTREEGHRWILGGTQKINLGSSKAWLQKWMHVQEAPI